MASQWIRWNSTTHIFEYSTNNGSSYAALPLDASVINEGTLDDARLSANVPLLNAANIFTNAAALSIQNANPYVEFKETDQGADLKFWRAGAQGALFNLDKLTDALVSTNLIAIDRNGYVTVSAQAAGGHAFNGNFNGDLASTIRNSSAGAAARGIAYLGNDSSATRASIILHSSGFTTSGVSIADGLLIQNAGAGGIGISAGHASGVVNIYTAGSGVSKATFNTIGDLVLNNANGGIYEHGRSTKLGETIGVTYASGNFTASAGTWTVDSGDQAQYRYSLVGKIMTIWVSLTTTSTSAGFGAELWLAIPGGFSVANTVHCPVIAINAGTNIPAYVYTIFGETKIRVAQAAGGNWPSSITNNLSLFLTFSFPIQ